MYVLTVKRPGGRTEHFAVEKKVQAMTQAQQLGARLPRGGSVSILERTGGGLRLVGGLVKNPNLANIGRQVKYIHDVLHGRRNPRRRR